MHKRLKFNQTLLSFLLAVIPLLYPAILNAEPAPADQLTPIDRYVASKDRSYRWDLVDVVEEEAYDTVLIDFTSQRWLNEQEVNRPKWEHRLVLTIPKELHQTDIGFLYIGGGSHTRDPATTSSDRLVQLALATQTIAAELYNVPYQPLEFHGDGRARTEDDLIAYAWVQFIGTGDARWLPRGPMVKSAVRAMDTITRYTKRHLKEIQPIEKFVVAGGSKRGWTTWLTAAVDERVVALAPIVIDVLNVDKSMRHHFAAYGFFAPSIGDYVNHRIMLKMGSPELNQLYQYTDPYHYMNRLKMPKLVLNATGDQFFLPDSSRFYWDQLPGPKYLRYVPNTNHGLGNSDAMSTLAGFHYQVTRNENLPNLSWTYESDSAVNIQFSEAPIELTLWQAHNPNARDFRLETLGPEYEASPLSVDGIESRILENYQVETPTSGWTAWFIEATFNTEPAPLKLSTEVRVTPDKLPFEGKLPNQRTSLTFVISDAPEDETLFEDLASALTDNNLGRKLSITHQGNRTYINFVPVNEARSAFFPVAHFLRQRYGEDVDAKLQLESGVAPTLLPN